MHEIYKISGVGNSSGLKVFESGDGETLIKVPKTLISRSWRYLALGLILLVLSVVIPILVNIYIKHFLVKMGFFAISFSMLIMGTGLSAVAIWEIRTAIEIQITRHHMTIFHPAFFKYRSLKRKYQVANIEKLYVNKVRRLGTEKYSLMLENVIPPDERLIKGFYLPEQALWIASHLNKHF